MTYISNIARSPGDPRVLQTGMSSRTPPDDLARFLGWFSIGLGALELLAPRKLAGALGLEGKETLIRAYGAREIGAGILSLSVDKQLGLWSRVAGDGIDVATLLSGFDGRNPKRPALALALALVLGVSLLDLAAAGSVGRVHGRARGQNRDYSERSGFPNGRGGNGQRPGSSADQSQAN